MRLRPSSLRARLTLVFALGGAVVLGIALALLYAALDNQVATALDRDLTVRVADLGAAVGAGDETVVAGDPMAQLYAADGAVLAGSPALGDQRLLPAEQVRRLEGHALMSRTLPARGDAAAVHARVLAQRLGDGRVLAVGTSVRPLQEARRGLLEVLLAAGPLLLGALAATVWLVVRAALQPVDALTREAASIASFESDRALPAVAGNDEIARLAATLDGMLRRLRVAFERERAFVDDASHELRTPIAVLRGELEFALVAEDDPAERERSLRAALGEAEHLSRLAEDLLLLARERAGALVIRRQPVDLLDLAAAEAERLHSALPLRIRVTGTPVVVLGDTDRLRQVLSNLLDNSATAGATTVQIRSTVDEDTATLEIGDDGPGFPPEVLPSVFGRFVRGLRAGGGPGAGLGLAIVRAVVSAHGGTVEAGNGGPLGGAVIGVHLPLR